MSRVFRRRLLILTALGLLTPVPPALGQAAFTAERLVRMEAFGAVQITPSGRWAIVERRGPYDSAGSYALGQFASATITDLIVADATGRMPDRVIGEDDTAGYQIGPVSPDERRMVVYRQRGAARDLGVLTFQTGALQWFTVTPELPVLGRTIAWRGDGELLVVAMAAGETPLYHRLGHGTQDRTIALWRAAADGRQASVTQVWSGEDRDRRAHAPPRRLVRVALDGGLTVLAEGDFIDLEPSPDGRHVAVLGAAEDLQPSPDARITIGTPTRRRRLDLIDLETGEVTRPTTRDVLSHLLAWSPDSDTLLVFARPDGQAWTDGEVIAIRPRIGTGTDVAPLDLGPARPAVLETAGEKTPYVRAVWTDDGPLVLADHPDGRRAWTSPGGRPRLEAGGAASRFARREHRTWAHGSGGAAPLDAPATRLELQPVPGSTSPAGSRASWNPDPVALGRTALRDPDGCLRAGPAAAARLCPWSAVDAVAANASTAVSLETDPNGVRRAVLWREAGTRSLAVLNEDFAAVSWPAIREVRHADRDGAALSSWLLLPPGAPPPDGWPVILSIYPGRVWGQAPGAFQPGSEMSQLSPLVLTGAGYAVLAASLPLTPADAGAMPDLSRRLEQILAAAAAQADIDQSRVAIMGHSFGGQAALRVATQSDRFQAIVASAAMADLGTAVRETPFFRTHPEEGVYSNSAAGYFESGQGAMGRLPWDQPDAFVAASPLYGAGRISTPVLMIAGDQDPIGSESMFAALYRRNQDASLITYWGEGHNLVSPANIVDLHHRVIRWLDEKLRVTRPAD